jgi:cytochrome oxidase Cu insertion factor (SCO1/SenC/PrrC family)
VRLNAPAPDFTLTDQFGKRVSLHSLHGKVVVLSFNDPECTTICPLTTTAVLQAKKVLGSAASQVALVGVGANPEATKLKWVRDDSRVHGMLHKWRFLTGSLAELKRVWRAYYVAATVVNGSIDDAWETEVTDLSKQPVALNRYPATAKRKASRHSSRSTRRVSRPRRRRCHASSPQRISPAKAGRLCSSCCARRASHG